MKRTVVITVASMAAMASAAVVAGCGSSSDGAGTTGAATTRAAASDQVNPRITVTNNLPVAVRVTARNLEVKGQGQATPWTADGNPFDGSAALQDAMIGPGASVERSWNATSFAQPHCTAQVKAGSDYANPTRATVFIDVADADGGRTLVNTYDYGSGPPRALYATVQMGYTKAAASLEPECGADPVLVARGWVGGRSTATAINAMSQCPEDPMRAEFREFTYPAGESATARGTYAVKCGIGAQSAQVVLEPLPGGASTP